jgi:hypothetical protein
MKYINIDGIGMITFPDTIDHSKMYDLVSKLKPGASIIGAGKIGGQGDELVPDYLYCYGESITLGYRCDEEKDNWELERNLRLF